MTAPVVQREGGRPGSHIVGFVMPADETLETLPEPDDLGVTLRAVPVEFAAALRYSGRWTQAGYEEGAARLQRAIADTGLRAIGQPQWARFDPPRGRPGFCAATRWLFPSRLLIPSNPEHRPRKRADGRGSLMSGQG
jgi:hypothetical protein